MLSLRHFQFTPINTLILTMATLATAGESQPFVPDGSVTEDVSLRSARPV